MSNIRTSTICEDAARECVRLARMTDDPELRIELLKLARDWMAAAMAEEKHEDASEREPA